MTKRNHIALAILILSLPSLLFLWWNRDVPHFGILQDDGLYFIAGKALAQGSAYRIESLPSQPYQTKYPPLYPLLLSVAWRIDPSFPSNLTAALLLSWLCLPVVALLFYLWCRRNGLETRASWLVVALFALNPYVLFFVSNLGSELLFTAFALGSILLAENREIDWRWVLGAGALAGAAYLTRTAGIALLPAAIVYFLWQRQPRKALWFNAGMLPAIVGWTLWSRSHTAGGHDMVTLYYTNYFAYQLANVTRDNILVVLWKNFSGLLEALGSFLFPQMLQGLPGKIILQPLAIAMILGCVRMARRQVSLYLIFAAISACVLLVWHGVPNQRLVMPLVPLFLAGFWTEAVHFSGLVRKALHHRDRSQRVVAYGFAGFLIAILATGLGLNIYMWAGVLPEMARSDRQDARAYDVVYRWVDAHTPAEASVLWEDDTVLYLATGRRAASLIISARNWYEDDVDLDMKFYPSVDQYARQQNLQYIILPNLGPHRNDKVLSLLAKNPGLEKIHEESGGVVYRVR